MINLNGISNINTDSDEGKLLLAAIAILTSITEGDIKEKKWGGMTHPDRALNQVEDLAMKIFHEEQYDRYLLTKRRDNKIHSILSSPEDPVNPTTEQN